MALSHEAWGWLLVQVQISGSSGGRKGGKRVWLVFANTKYLWGNN